VRRIIDYDWSISYDFRLYDHYDSYCRSRMGSPVIIHDESRSIIRVWWAKFEEMNLQIITAHESRLKTKRRSKCFDFASGCRRGRIPMEGADVEEHRMRTHRREHIVPNGLLTTVTNCSFPTASVRQTDCHSYSHYPVAARRQSNAGCKRDASLQPFLLEALRTRPHRHV